MKKEMRQVKMWLWFVILSLFFSGVTTIPASTELSIVLRIFPTNGPIFNFLSYVEKGVLDTQLRFPFLFYGYDWLAFAHFVLAILFIGPLRDPIRNRWVLEFGIVACLLVIPFAMIAGYCRDIPIWWRLVDCSFGVFGIIPLLICCKKLNALEAVGKRTFF